MSVLEDILEETYAVTSDLPEVDILYVNWKDVPKAIRVKPMKWFFGSTEWHPTPQYLMQALDVEKGESRCYAMEGIRGWLPRPNSALRTE